VVGGSALALTAAILPAQAAIASSAQATNPSWRAQVAVPIKGELANFSGVDAVKETDGWTVGAAATSTETKVVPLIEHWTGSRWDRIHLPAAVNKAWGSPATVYDIVAASSPTSVWAFGQLPNLTKGYDVYLRYNGKAWTTGRLPGTTISKGDKVQVTAAAAVSRSDVWVFGGQVKVIDHKDYWAPWSEHFNGHQWAVKDVPGLGEIAAISAVSYKDIWAVTGTSQFASSLIPDRFVAAKVLHWTGKRWLVAETQPKQLPVHAILTAVMAGTGNHVWVAGAAPMGKAGTSTQFADHLSGSSWQPAVTHLKMGRSVSTCQPESIVSDGQGGLWVLGVCLVQSRSQFWHYNGTAWSTASSPSFGGRKALPLQLANVPGTDSVWAVGAVEHGTSVDALIGIDGPSLG
jgi:hypothetical protein